MKKILFSIVLVSSLMLCFCLHLFAFDDPAWNDTAADDAISNADVTDTTVSDTTEPNAAAVDAANHLYSLGLFQGTETDADGNPNFDLARAPRRDEAIAMLVRMIGKEKEALAQTWRIPFTDVADWAKPYVGYAYANNLANGTSVTTFGSADSITAAQYITLVLRALGYSDAKNEFVWDSPWTFSDEIGLTHCEYTEQNNTCFTRGDAAIISNAALSCSMADQSSTLIDHLSQIGTPLVSSAVLERLAKSDYPDYIKAEVLAIVQKVNVVRRDDSIVFAAMSDNHYVADQKLYYYDAETNASTRQAANAVKLLSELLQPDFLANLGDVSSGHSSTPPSMLKQQIDASIGYFLDAGDQTPVFIAIGNHDVGIYYHNAQTDGKVHTLSGDDLFASFTSHSASEDTVFGSTENGGYCYRDFPDKKLRVFLLNTSEKLIGAQNDQALYGAQRLWFANSLLELNSKADAPEWSFLVLSHYPADFGSAMPLSELLKSYIDGMWHTISDPVSIGGDGTYQTVNFYGKNSAQLLAQFHGHIHNLLVDHLYSYASGSGKQYDALRICIPNAQYNRENYYTTVGRYTDTNFSDAQTYPKTANSSDGTSFVVNVINRSEGMIYSFCYGAGYDRTISLHAPAGSVAVTAK